MWRIFLYQVYTNLAYVPPTYRRVKKLQVLIINKSLRLYLASRNGNDILIWSWNSTVSLCIIVMFIPLWEYSLFGEIWKMFANKFWYGHVKYLDYSTVQILHSIIINKRTLWYIFPLLKIISCLSIYLLRYNPHIPLELFLLPLISYIIHLFMMLLLSK